VYLNRKCSPAIPVTGIRIPVRLEILPTAFVKRLPDERNKVNDGEQQ
jgi:hypothetical protein